MQLGGVPVNNAGIQRRVDLAKRESWMDTRQEIAINLDAPIFRTSKPCVPPGARRNFRAVEHAGAHALTRRFHNISVAAAM